jgi:hypothetical protein
MAGELSESEIIYDWNSVEKVAPISPRRRIQFLDETLRDGIQSPSVVDPSIDDKLRLVELANDLGIDTMDIGLPGAGQRGTGQDRGCDPILSAVVVARSARRRGSPFPSGAAAAPDRQSIGQATGVAGFGGSTTL